MLKGGKWLVIHRLEIYRESSTLNLGGQLCKAAYHSQGDKNEGKIEEM